MVLMDFHLIPIKQHYHSYLLDNFLHSYDFKLMCGYFYFYRQIRDALDLFHYLTYNNVRRGL